MADIHSATAEIRRGKKEERRRRTNDRMKIYMVCPITHDDHKIYSSLFTTRVEENNETNEQAEKTRKLN